MDAEIAKVQAGIEAVEKQIEEAAARFLAADEQGDNRRADYWAKEKEQLRKEKEQLRKKEEQLREKELQELKEKEQLRKEKEQLREKELQELKEKEQLRKKEEQLREKELQELKQAATVVGDVDCGPDEAVVLASLLEHYGAAAMNSRTTPTRTVERDLGQEFDILGRSRTYEVLLKGCATMFSQFLDPGNALLGYRRGQPLIFGMVAFPGAGKTTLGIRGWSFLRERWNSLTDLQRHQFLDNDLPKEEDYQRFVKMCDDSLQYNLCMFHTVAHSDGGLFGEELGLGPAQILALRCLVSVISPAEKYLSFLKTFERRLPGIKRHLTLQVVLKFLRAVLPDLKDETEILVPFYFDEINAITKDFEGKEVMVDSVLEHGKATWMHKVLSVYTSELWDLAKDFEKIKVFPTMCIASTRFSAADLRFTESANTLAFAVPFPPLLTEEAEQIVLKLLQNWAHQFQLDSPQELTTSVKHLVKLSGGMPRALSWALEATVAVRYAPGDQIVKRQIFQQCVSDLQEGSLLSVIDRWSARMGMGFTSYLKNPATRPVLLRVLLDSLTAREVQRHWPVVETGIFSHLHYTDLEAAGLVALTVSPGKGHRQVSGGPQLMDLDVAEPVDEPAEEFLTNLDGYKTSYLGAVEVLVRCCPLVVRSLLGSGSLDVDIPSLLSTDHRQKEVDDLAGILLRIYLLDVSMNEQEFKLSKILPPGTKIPKALDDVNFRLYKKSYRLVAWDHKGSWETMLIANPEAGAFLGPGNEGGDGLLLLEKVPRLESEEGPFCLILQSKQTQSMKKEAFTPLLTNFYENLTHLGVKLSGINSSEDMKKIAEELNRGSDTGKLEKIIYTLPSFVSDFGYVYCSNRNFSDLHIQKLKNFDLGPKLIVSYECLGRAYEDASNVLGVIRTLKRPFDLVR